LSGARRRAAAVLAVTLLAPAAAGAAGTRHALLIGVGRYTHLPKATLEGPPFDVQALQAVLTGRFGFEPGNVAVLLDERATKPAILAAIDALAGRTRPGDFVFIYFSGHGTSGYDKAFKDVGLDGGTGALVPADFKLAAPPELSERLIVGSRDLRPRLSKLDGDREVLVAFDSCFSGNSARDAFAPGQARYVAPLELLAPASRGLAALPQEERGVAADPPYPYRSVVYVSASSKSERAMDIGSALIRSGRVKTVDGRPHGAFTNAFLDGLSGAADTNTDGTVTNEELYLFVKDQVSERFPHQPQLLVADGSREALLRSPVFGSARAEASAPPAPVPAPTPSASAGSFRVKLQGVAPPLASTITGIPGVGLAEAGGYDLLVVQDEQGFKLVHPSGDVLASYEGAQLAEVLKRISRQVAVQGLIDLKFPDQDFNVALEVPGNRGFLTQGEPFTIEFSTERESHVLLMDIDGEGYVSVLYPFDAAEARPTRKGRVPASGELQVSPPFGTDYLKLVAFEQKPAGFERWMGRTGQHFAPSGPEVADLLRMIRAAPGSKAQARLKLVTRGPR
jgi:hypothetical protein